MIAISCKCQFLYRSMQKFSHKNEKTRHKDDNPNTSHKKIKKYGKGLLCDKIGKYNLLILVIISLEIGFYFENGRHGTSSKMTKKAIAVNTSGCFMHLGEKT